MKVSFDSNAWEKVFDLADRNWGLIRSAVSSGQLAGFICEAAFRIEAVRRRQRTTYFAQPAMDVRFAPSIAMIKGEPHLRLVSIGPDNDKHPGLAVHPVSRDVDRRADAIRQMPVRRQPDGVLTDGHQLQQ